MNDFELSRLIILLGFLALVAMGWSRRRRDTKTELKNVLIWGGIVAILVLGWMLFH